MIVKESEAHVRRQFPPELLHLFFQCCGDIERAAVRLAVDVQQHGIPALRRHGLEDRLRPALDPGHVFDLHRVSVLNRHHQIFNVSG